MNVLIIGGTGFIGPHVAGALVAAGHTVTIFHRGKTTDDLPKMAAYIHGDRSRLADFGRRLRRLAFDAVVDVIPLTERDAKELVAVFRGTGARLVVLSSGDVYRNYGLLLGKETGPPDPIPLTEDSPLRGTLYPYRSQAKDSDDWMYHYDKILVEQAVMDATEARGTVLRLPMVYGPRDHHRTDEYLKRMDDNRPAILLEETKARFLWTRGYVENVAAAIALATVDSRAVGQIFNVGEQCPLTERAWVRRIARIAGWNGQVVEVPPAELPKHLRAPFHWNSHLAMSTARIRDELGFREPVAWQEGLLGTLAWERSDPPGSEHPAQFDYKAEDECLRRLGRSTRQSG